MNNNRGVIHFLTFPFLFQSIEQAGGMGMRTLDEGERVEYYVEMGPKGLSACNVRRLGRV